MTHFELPSHDYHELDPARKDMTETGLNWEINRKEIEELIGGDENLGLLFEDVLDQTLRYTMTVLEHLETREHAMNNPERESAEEHAEKGRIRHLTHEATVSTIQSFYRALIKAGKPREELEKLMPRIDTRAGCASFAVRLTLSRIEDIANN